MDCDNCGKDLTKTDRGVYECQDCGFRFLTFEPDYKAEDVMIDPKASYYDAGDISTMDIIRAKLTPEQFKGFLLGNQIKYSCRLNFKGDPKRDSEKAANYARLLKELNEHT